MLLLIGVSLALASSTYVLVPDSFEETLHHGHTERTRPGTYTVSFPGRSGNRQLDIEPIMEETPIDFVVSWSHLIWGEYSYGHDPEWGLLYEAFNASKINETLNLELDGYTQVCILIREVECGTYHLRGHIIASCDCYRHVIPLMVRDELWLLTFVVTAVLVGDIISTYISRRETQTS